MSSQLENQLAAELESFNWLFKQAIYTDTHKQAKLAFDLISDALRSLAKVHAKIHLQEEDNKVARDYLMSIMSGIADQIHKIVSFFGLELLTEATKDSLSNFKIISISEISSYLKVTPNHVTDFILHRKLPVFKIMGRFYIVAGVLDAWAKAQRDEARKQNTDRKEKTN